MHQKTTTIKHTKYFDVIDSNTQFSPDLYIEAMVDVGIRSTNVLFKSNKPVILKAIDGIVLLLVSDSPDISRIQRFVLHGLIQIKESVYFNLISISPTSRYLTINEKDSTMIPHHLVQKIFAKQIKENFFVPQIYAFYSQLKKGPYYYSYESHSYCEMTIIDSGEFTTTVDDVLYILNESNLIIYGPQQIHNQEILPDINCSYITIMFEMNPVKKELLNKVHILNQNQLRLIQEIIRITNIESPYVDELVISKFKELIITLLISPDDEKENLRLTTMRSNYENDLLNRMLHYIHEHHYSSVQVSDLCDYFAISRSTVQTIFKKYLQVTPKNYINEIKLKQSKVMINDSKYTLSEIATMLGYSSIHYFSRAFKQMYHMTPSDYAKSILK